MLRTPRPGALLTVALATVALASAALAQPTPDAAPTAGTATLAPGFAPDPYAMDVMAGGSVEAAEAAPDCPGFVDAAPSAVLAYGGNESVDLFVRASTDTVLLVHTPSGEWLCNDDDEGLNPGLVVGPTAGRYAVWVGTFSGDAGMEAPATLYVSAQRDGAMLDPDGTPSAGRITLDAGFSPDPFELDVEAGGETSALAFDGCAGFVDAAAPTAVLDYGGSGPLYLYARAASEEDLTLVVMGPDGALSCNDDADGFDPGLAVDPASAGRYAVWVGTYSSRARTEPPIGATLFVSEVGGPTAEDFIEEDFPEEGVYGGGEDISLFASPAHGTLPLDAGFDARSTPVEAGGPDAVSVSGFGCVGYIDNGEPDLNVLYDGEGDLLAFYTESDDDLTLVVNLPDGSWRCNDDAIERNPAIVVEAPEGGLYNVWVGTYSQTGGADATLVVAERDPR
ncbi:MAG: hypothetical protein R3181_14685 [Rubricoccaceae bacterium]|nr:hypothetical protein [Rubricoccaceae bacterium]